EFQREIEPIEHQRACVSLHCARKHSDRRDTPMKVLSYDDLKSQKGIGYSKVSLWRLEKRGKFPRRIALGPSRHGWLDSEIDEWIAARAAERNAPAAS